MLTIYLTNDIILYNCTITYEDKNVYFIDHYINGKKINKVFKKSQIKNIITN